MTHTIESQCGVTFFRRGSPPEEWRCKASALTDGRGHGGMDGLMRGISVSRGPALSKCRASRGVTKFLLFATLCPRRRSTDSDAYTTSNILARRPSPEDKGAWWRLPLALSYAPKNEL